MGRTFNLLSRLLFLSFMLSEALAYGHEARSAPCPRKRHVVQSWTLFDEEPSQALELLQLGSTPLAKGEASEKRTKQIAGPKTDTIVKTLTNNPKKQDSQGEALIQNEDAETMFQNEEATEQVLNDDEGVELNAHHPLWDDQVVVYRDGFCQRYDNAEPCLWRLQEGTLVLDWLNFPSEELHTSDDGRHFISDYNFKLENEYPPVWWVQLFRNALPNSAQGEEWSKEVRKAAILETHGSGNRVICNEKGYAAIQKLGDANQMEIFIRRLMALTNLSIPDDGALKEFSKRQAEGTGKFGKLVHELEMAALTGAPLIQQVKHFDGVLDP